MKIFNITKGVRGSKTMYENTLKRKQYSGEEIDLMNFRIKVIKHSDQYGIKSSVDAFNVSKRSILRWKAKLKERNSIYDLIKTSTRPRNFRESKIKQYIIDFIKEIKLEQPKLGKAKISKMIEERFKYIISATKVQTIVNDLKSKGILREKVKYSLNGKTGKLHILKKKKHIKLRIEKGYKPKEKGELLQTDTVVIVYFGKRYYCLTLIDIFNRIAFAKVYRSHSSKTASEFLKEAIDYFNYPFKQIQTDNGSEFNLHFDIACKELNILHYYNYPRSPKMNAFVERFNRTLREEYLEKTKSIFAKDDLERVNLHLLNYLKFYNNERPHWGLNLMTPRVYNEKH